MGNSDNNSLSQRLFESSIANGVRGLRPYQPGKPIEEIQRDYQIKHVIKLASNENPLGFSPNVLKVIQEEASGCFRYPDGNGDCLKQALVDYYEREIDSDQITLGNGSNDVLELVARAFLNPGDHAIYSEHAFAVYALACQAVNAEVTVTPAKHWGHDLEAVAQAVRPETKLIFLANPNNPTGTWFNRAAWEALLEKVSSQVLIVLDEAYAEYIYDPGYPSGVNYLQQHPNLIVCKTFSKAYGLAGLRVGYALSSSEIADYLNRVRQPFNVNQLALKAATAALQDQHFVDRSSEFNLEGRETLSSRLHDMGLSLIPSVANFVCVNFEKPAAKINQKLLERGVIVRPVANYGMSNFLRVSVGTQDENRRFLEVLAEVLDET